MILRCCLVAAAILSGGTSAHAQSNVNFAVAPPFRTLPAGEVRTGIMSMINAGDADATNCRLDMSGSGYTGEYFEITIANGVITGNGARNTPFDIPAGQVRYGAFALSADQTVNTAVVGGPDFTFVCDNDASVGQNWVGRMLFQPQAGNPPDIIASMSTLSNDGVLRVTEDGRTARAGVAAINLNPDNDLTSNGLTRVTVEPSFVNEYTLFPNYEVPFFPGPPFTLEICPSNPVNGQCLSPPAASATVDFSGTDALTFVVFLRDTLDYGAPLFPQLARIRVDFLVGNPYEQGLVGAATVAFTTPGPESTSSTAGGLAGTYVGQIQTSDGNLANGRRENESASILIDPAGRFWMRWFSPERPDGTRNRHITSGQLSTSPGSNGEAQIQGNFGGATFLRDAQTNDIAGPASHAGTVSGRGGRQSHLVLHYNRTDVPANESEWPATGTLRAYFDGSSILEFPTAWFQRTFTSVNASVDGFRTITFDANGGFEGSLVIDDDRSQPSCTFTGTYNRPDASRPMVLLNGTTGCSFGSTSGVEGVLYLNSMTGSDRVRLYLRDKTTGDTQSDAYRAAHSTRPAE